MNKFGANLRHDLPASIVVFLVAVPLCLGIAVGSGAPPITGLLAGIIGGIVVGLMSGSNLSVSGPAAGLISTVALILAKVPAFEAFLLSVMLAGIMQVIFGVIKAGIVVNFVPVSVLRGMLTAIGILLILKQFPHLVGYDRDFEGDESLMQPDGHNTFSEIQEALLHITPLAVVIGFLGLGIQMFWDSKYFPLKQVKKVLPGPLVVVVVGIVLSQLAVGSLSDWAIQAEHMVTIPVLKGWNELSSLFRFPDFSYIGEKIVWVSALQIAIIASIESLLGVEAVDKLDDQKRITDSNRELVAQGVGNFTAGMLGALPITSVIVRSSANVYAGAKTKMSAVFHGIIMMVAIFLFPGVLNMIPLSALAAILIYTGFKLAKPTIFKKQWQEGRPVFIPFMVTIIAILLSDLLVGVCIGILVGIYYVIKSNFHESVRVAITDNNYLLKFGAQVSFLNKITLKQNLEKIPTGANVLVDLSKCQFIDHDISEIMEDFNIHAKKEGIHLEYRFMNIGQQKKMKIKKHGIVYKTVTEQQAVGGGEGS
jgi:MFS superfamily sulfate permease-like transporter